MASHRYTHVSKTTSSGGANTSAHGFKNMIKVGVISSIWMILRSWKSASSLDRKQWIESMIEIVSYERTRVNDKGENVKRTVSLPIVLGHRDDDKALLWLVLLCANYVQYIVLFDVCIYLPCVRWCVIFVLSLCSSSIKTWIIKNNAIKADILETRLR